MHRFARLSAALTGDWPQASDRRRQLVSLLLFPVTIAVLLAVVYVGMTLLSGIRAYVGGESLWSKAQKTAVQSLYRFAITRDEADYDRYIEGLAVPMADRRARLELQKPKPDVAYAVRSFIEGKNHPEDSRQLVLLFRYFGRVSYMRRAIEIWMAGDAKIDELDHEARRLHALVRSGVTDPLQYRAVLRHVDRIDDDLTVLEAEFSTVLGEGARWLRRVVLAVVILTGAMLAWIGTAIWQRLLRHERTARGHEIRLRIGERHVLRIGVTAADRHRLLKGFVGDDVELVAELDLDALPTEADLNRLGQMMLELAAVRRALDEAGPPDLPPPPPDGGRLPRQPGGHPPLEII